MKRRSFLQGTAAAVAISGMGRTGLLHALEPGWMEINTVSVVLPEHATKRERVAAEMVIDEIMKRCGVEWTMGTAGTVKLYLGTRASWRGLGNVVASVAEKAAKLPAEVSAGTKLMWSCCGNTPADCLSNGAANCPPRATSSPDSISS